jgi:ABC-type phosphate transport system substrate-binding protein
MILLLQLAILFLISGPVAAQETASFKVIVNASNDISSMTKEQVSELFLKKVIEWGNGRKALPVDQPSSSPVREKFSKEIHEKTVTAVNSYWRQKIFSGRDVPPPEKSSDADVLTYVEANADAIGYVSPNAPVDKVKVLKITK